MSDARLDKILEIIQEDVGNRGLRNDPHDNLITACPRDFHDACQSLADATNPIVGILTGFLIPHAEPPCGETDGPLGAICLARVLVALGAKPVLISDSFCVRALNVGLGAYRFLNDAVPIVDLTATPASDATHWVQDVLNQHVLTHLIALERVGPSHTRESVRAQRGTSPDTEAFFLREVPEEHRDRCHTMRGRDITRYMAPAHLLVEEAHRQGITTIGIGDGGNEIGMGKIPWETIRRNIPGGAVVACRVPTDYLIVAGVSNWGAYGLAAGVSLLRNGTIEPKLFCSLRERILLREMVERGPLVDGITGKPTDTVDGLEFERYVEPLDKIYWTVVQGI